jgi:DNA-binding response OmpR family regulator
MNQATIFLLENDDDTRPLFKRVLEENGYNVLLAIDETDALQRTGDGMAKSDLLIINLLGKSETEMLNFGRELKAKANLNMPFIVVAAKYGEELQGVIKQVEEKEYIIYLEDAEELFDLIARLTKPSD